jgi:predicted nucleic acid-binding protein
MSPAGRGVLLDTSVVIDHFRGDPRIHYELESTAVLYIPTIVLGELYYGTVNALVFFLCLCLFHHAPIALLK